jgi:hypothetical protein
LLFNVLKSVVTFLASSHFDDILNVIDEDLAIAEVAGIKDFLRGFNDVSDRDFADDDVDLNLWKEVGVDSDATVLLFIALLLAKA